MESGCLCSQFCGNNLKSWEKACNFNVGFCQMTYNLLKYICDYTNTNFHSKITDLGLMAHPQGPWIRRGGKTQWKRHVWGGVKAFLLIYQSTVDLQSLEMLPHTQFCPVHHRLHTTFVQRCMSAHASIFGSQGAREGMIIQQEFTENYCLSDPQTHKLESQLLCSLTSTGKPKIIPVLFLAHQGLKKSRQLVVFESSSLIQEASCCSTWGLGKSPRWLTRLGGCDRWVE